MKTGTALALMAAALVAADRILLQADPFRGAPLVLPCRIEAEDFDTGGEGEGYHMAGMPVAPSAYRPEPVAISGSADLRLVNLAASEWVAFSVEVPEAGVYDLELWGRYALGFFTMELELMTANGARHLADWSCGTGLAFEAPVWQLSMVRGVSLPAGPARLRLVLVTANSPETRGAGVDWIRISQPRAVGAWTSFAGDAAAGFADGPGDGGSMTAPVTVVALLARLRAPAERSLKQPGVTS